MPNKPKGESPKDSTDTPEEKRNFPELSAGEAQSLAWRTESFRGLGFGEAATHLLACGKADLTSVRVAVRAGCPLDTALRIFL